MKIQTVKKSLWTTLLILLAAATMASVFLVLFYGNKAKSTVEPLCFVGSYQLDSGSPYTPLSDSSYINAGQHEQVVFKGSFDRALQKNAQLLFFMEYLEVHIYLNAQEIYSWGTLETHPAFLQSAGAAWGSCVLPDNITPSDEIVIVLKSKYTSNYTSAYHDFLSTLQTGDSGALAREVFAKTWPILLAGICLSFIGIALLLFTLLLLNQGLVIHISIYYCSFFVLSCSFWMLLDPVYSTLLFDNAPLIMLLETLTLWLFPTFLLAYCSTFMQTKAKQATNLLTFVYALSIFAFLVCQQLGMTDAYAIRGPYTAFMLVCLAVFLFILCYEYRHGPKAEMHTLLPASIIFAAFGVMEAFNYTLEWFTRGTALTIGLIMFITIQFVLAVRQLRQALLMSTKAISLEKDLIESRTDVMLSQIQPHFLYNTLVGIKELCDTGEPQSASHALEHFAYYLRSNLDSLSDKKLIPFTQEVSHVNDYLYLEKMRFEDKLCIVWDLQYTDFMLPCLTLQPMVENAVRHGITENKNGGTLTICSEKADNVVTITIQDNGVGFDTSTSPNDSRSHIGIENVKTRLAVLCGGLLHIESVCGVGTTVKIILPETENQSI